MTPFQEKEKTFILLADISRCFVRHWLKILFVMTCFLALGLWFAFNQPVRYRVIGTFKEAKGGDQRAAGQVVQNLLSQVGMATSAQSCHVVKSFSLRKKVAEELGLQASIQTETRWELRKRTIKENWLAERNIPLAEPDLFIFRHVTYPYDIASNYFLIFLSPEKFEIQDNENKVLAAGAVGKVCVFGDVSFTLEKTPQQITLQYAYPLTLIPVEVALINLSNQFTTEPHMKDATLYEFVLAHRDRKLAKKVIDLLMEKYQEHLRNETDRVSLEQIAYLEKRKEELCCKMDEYLKDHVTYLKNNLGAKGFLNLGQHLQHISGRKQRFLDQQTSIETEMARLNDWSTSSRGAAMSGELGNLQKEMYEYKKQRDTLDLAFTFQKKSVKKQFSPPYAPQQEKFFTYQDKLHQVCEAEEKIALAERGDSGAIASLFPSLFASINHFSNLRLKEQSQLNSMRKLYAPTVSELKALRLRKSELENALKNQDKAALQLVHQMEGLEEEDLVSYIEHQLRIASLQENILKERLFYPQQGQEAFQGVDLKGARVIYHDYLHIRDEHEAKIRQLKFSKEHLEEPDFEYISLVQILPDGVSQQLARSMGELTQSMRDTRNLSERDLERMGRRLKKDQSNLKRHIDQTIELRQLQISLAEERISTIQAVILDLLNQEISLLDQQIEDRVKQQKKSLQLERKLIEKQLQEIESELVMVPDQWLKEYQLQFSSDMNLNMLEGMVRMVESKNIEHNLIQVQSKPIDQAFSSLAPIPPRLKIFALIGSFIGLMMGFAFAIALDFSRGFPLSFKNLQLQGRRICGRFRRKKIYRHLDEVKGQNLQVLRNLSAAIPKSSLGCVTTLLSAKGSHYSRPFGELLAKEKKKVLHLDLDQMTKDPSGLFAYLNGDEKNLSVKKQGAIDHIPMGLKDRFSIELLKRPLFERFLEDQKKNYDVIIIQTSFAPGTPEGRFFMSVSDCMSLTLQTESNEILSPYYAWEDKGKTLAFVAN